jgi:hypothetical protein
MGIVYGYLIFNVDPLTSNQQFYIKSRKRVVKNWQSFYASHCELDDKFVTSPPMGTQLVRELVAGTSKHKKQPGRIRNTGILVSVGGQGVR